MTAAALTVSPGVTNERFGFTLFLSICMHAVFILGVGFSFYDQMRTSTSLDITLAQYRSEEAPEEADFLAQANQLGSGNLEEKAAPSSPFEAPLAADDIQEVKLNEQQAARVQVNDQPERTLLTSLTGDRKIPDELIPDTPDSDLPAERQNLDQEEITQTLASLQAQLDLQRQAYAKRPRRYTISSASTQKSSDAEYLDGWRRRIEAVGNRNYPEEATAQGLYGNLRLLVSIKPDGSVDSIRILRSSGHTVLDQAAIRIVNLAAPFDPFPDEIRANADILEVIRTWQFRQGNTFSSY